MMVSIPQLDLGFVQTQHASERAGRAPTGWRGKFCVIVDHRALFDGLCNEWLLPQSGQSGHLLSSHASPIPRANHQHLIMVRLWITIEACPTPKEVWVVRAGAWTATTIASVTPADEVLWWPGPLPLHRIFVEVATDEHRARLLGLASHVSNLEISCIEVSRPTPEAETPRPLLTLPQVGTATDPVSRAAGYDRVRGSAAMGWWALPRTPPWFDLLVNSHHPDDGVFARSLAAVDAPWLAKLPWRHGDLAPTDINSTLWLAALQVCASWTETITMSLLSSIVDTARQLRPDYGSELSSWFNHTRAILDGDRDLRLDATPDQAIGTALALVLARGEPERYKTWTRAHDQILPAVWWSGAILSGLLCGYRQLPIAFRGDTNLREFLAWRLLATSGANISHLHWRHDGSAIQFMEGDRVLVAKSETLRGAWYRAKLEESEIHDAAAALARRLGWDCWRRELILRDVKLPVHGGGQLTVRNGDLTAVGEVHIELPNDITISDVLDTARFRRSLTTRTGEVDTPPPTRRQPFAYPLDALKAGTNNTLHAKEDVNDVIRVPEVPGLLYLSSFLSEVEQAEIVGQIDTSDWLDDLKRRVQHYGWRYNYRVRQVTRDMKIGPLPDWATMLANRMHHAGLVPWIADQVIVNEYLESQGISKHIDCKPCFEGPIAMVSLLESWQMRFRMPATKAKVDYLLEHGSLAVMTGPARNDWTHEIPMRKREPSGLVRNRRISLTFRKVKLDT